MLEILLLFVILQDNLVFKFTNSFENKWSSNDRTDKFWSRVVNISPSSKPQESLTYKPKFTFKGVKERVHNNMDKSVVMNNNDWSKNNSKLNNINEKSDSVFSYANKSSWNILVDNFNSNDENSSLISSEIDENYSNSSKISNVVKKKTILINESTTVPDENLSTTSSLKNTNAVFLSKESTKFPIYFTNPVTGIVYAINPVATSQNHHPYGIDNFSSQMYVTKEEHEKKLQALKKHFHKECAAIRRKLVQENLRLKALTSSSTTTRPTKKKKIIKYEDPLIVETLGGVLDTVYDQVADAVTTTKIVRKKNKRRNSVKRKNSKNKIGHSTTTTTTTSTATEIMPLEDEPSPVPIIEGEVIEPPKKPQPILQIWRLPSTSKPSLSSHYMHNDYEYDDDSRYTLIAYNGKESENKNETRSVQTLPSITPPPPWAYYDNTSNKNFVPVPLTLPSQSKLKRKKRSINSLPDPENDINSTTNKIQENDGRKNVLTTRIKVANTYGSESSSKETFVNDDEVTPIQPKKQIIFTTTTPCPINQRTQQPNYYDADDQYFYDFDDIIFGGEEDYDEYSDEHFGINEISNANQLQDQSLESESSENGLQSSIDKKAKKILSLKKPFNKRRRDDNEDPSYDDYYDEPGFFSFVSDFMTSIQNTVSNLMPDTNDFLGPIDNDLETAETNDIRKSKIPKNSTTNSADDDNKNNKLVEDNESNGGFTSWLSSLFSSDDSENESVTVTEGSSGGWFDSWFGTEEKISDDNEDYSDSNWFFSWFESKPKNKRHTTTTPKPILTVSDPMINPQKWIGILAQHIVNSSTTTPQTPNTIESELEQDFSEKVSYDKHQIWRLQVTKDSHVRDLEKYRSSADGAKLQWFLGPSIRGLTDVAVPPKLISNFQTFLKSKGIGHEVLIFDFGKAILYEESKEKLAPKPKKSCPIDWYRYHNYDEILRFGEYYQVKNHSFVELIHIGRSYEGRPLVVIKVSSKIHSNHYHQKKKKKTRSAVLIEAGAHGREWIGPATATWIVNELVKIMQSNATTPTMETIKKMTWYIMPVLNPDGYTYSQDFDRLWKKSRSRNIVKANSGILDWFQTNQPAKKVCYGIDLDRNWDWEWLRKGSSKAACNEFFAGYSAFSEPETKAFSKFMLDNRKEIKIFISLHSYGQIISFPSTTKTSYVSQTLDDLLEVAMVGIDGLRRTGTKTRYKIDSSNDLVSAKSGSADGFALNIAGIPYSYTIHLGDNGVHGFLLPGSYIESTSRDAFEIIKAMLDYIY